MFADNPASGGETNSAMSEFSKKRMAASGDPLADAVALRIDRRRPSNMLEEVHFLAKSTMGVFQEFVDQLNCVPDWVDWQLIERGRQVQASFKHARSLAVLTYSMPLGFCRDQSLLWLVKRGYLAQEVVRRVHETNQLIHSVSAEDGLKPGNPAHRVLAEVRLSNAMMRKSLLSRQRDEAQPNMPVNQLDMAFHMLQYGHLAVRGMEKLGVHLKPKDHQAIQHYWRYCGYLYGVNEQLLASDLEQQEQLYTQLFSSEATPLNEHKRMVNSSLNALTNDMALNLPLELIQELARLTLGESKANTLGIAKQARWKRTAMLYATANRGATFAYYNIPGMGIINDRLNDLISHNMLITPDESKIRFQHKKDKIEKIA